MSFSLAETKARCLFGIQPQESQSIILQGNAICHYFFSFSIWNYCSLEYFCQFVIILMITDLAVQDNYSGLIVSVFTFVFLYRIYCLIYNYRLWIKYSI